MATITISQFSKAGRDADGDKIPMASGFIAGETMTAAGTSAAMADDARFVRIATDTAFLCNVYGAGTAALLPAGAIDFFPVRSGQQIIFTAVT